VVQGGRGGGGGIGHEGQDGHGGQGGQGGDGFLHLGRGYDFGRMGSGTKLQLS
jgi:hypothetical protein